MDGHGGFVREGLVCERGAKEGVVASAPVRGEGGLYGCV